jgi:PAS domain S-box-containing protein
MRIIFPSLPAIVLFVAAIWGMILPSFERILIERKRDTILELTHSALSILASYERDERAGLLTRRQAQQMAKSRIEALRYGQEGKDYFWIQDMHPHVIMHPYRPDLNGRDVSEFTDPRGVRIFVEFADLVRRKQKGYIEYVWQWKDDPARLEAKESYVSGFAPWNWIIGTGIYSDDVHREIKRIEKSLVHALLAISAVLVIWLLYTLHQSLRIERDRRDMEENLRDSTQRYRSLVEATTEGTLLVIDGRCRYANPILLQLLEYSIEQIELLDLSDLLARSPDNETAWAHIERLEREGAGSGSSEAVLQRSDNRKVECIITLNPISFAGHPGFILLAKEVYPALKAEKAASGAIRKMAQAAESVSIGLFQAKAVRRGAFVAMNPAARTLIQATVTSGQAQPALADLFTDPAAYEAFMEQLQTDGRIDELPIHSETGEAKSYRLSLSVTLVRDDRGTPVFMNGVIRDITMAVKRESEQADAIAASHDFLMHLRLRQQCHAIHTGRQLDNGISPDKLGDMEAAMLKQTFAQIAAVQRNITYDFLGGAQWQGP